MNNNTDAPRPRPSPEDVVPPGGGRLLPLSGEDVTRPGGGAVPLHRQEDALRRVLEVEAAAVEVRPDALGEIRRRIERRRRWAPWGLALGGGAVAAFAGGVAAVVLMAGPAGPPTVSRTAVPAAPAPFAPPSGDVDQPPPTTVPPSPPATGPSAGRAVTATVPVYFVGVDRGKAESGGVIERPRLYREFHRLAAGDGSPAGRVRAALTAMLSEGAAADPDYRGAWPAGAGVREVRVEDGTVTVDLSGARLAGAEVLDAERATLAVQQLVWTVTGASDESRVRLLLDGRPAARLWGHVPADGSLRRDPMVDVVAPVWLIEPQHGAVVGRKVAVHVAGIVFEATAQLRVRNGSRVVAERVLTLSAAGPSQGQQRLTLDLPPGTYVIEAYEVSAVDGSEQHMDDHVVTVR